MLINPTLPYLAQLAFLNTSDPESVFRRGHAIPTPNRRHTITRVELAGLDRKFVLKEYRIPRSFRWGRKLELCFHEYFDSYAIQAFHGALRLAQAGIPSFVPVACWQSGQGLNRRSYLLMEELPISSTLKQIYLDLSPSSDHIKSSNLNLLLSKAGRVIRQLHNLNLFHRDITLNNFLVQLPADDDCSKAKLFLVDLERLKPASWLSRIHLRIRKVRSNYNSILPEKLNRLELDQFWLAPFLQGYLESKG